MNFSRLEWTATASMIPPGGGIFLGHMIVGIAADWATAIAAEAIGVLPPNCSPLT